MRHLELPRRCLIVMATAVVAVSVGCGPDDEESLEHETAQKRLESHTDSISSRVSTSSTFVESSDLLDYSTETWTPSLAGCDPESTSCESDTDTGFDVNADEIRDRLLEKLNTYVFKKENITDRSESAITYAVRGEDFCVETYEICGGPSGDSDDCREVSNDNYEQCVEQFDEMNYRVRLVTSASEALEFEVLVGPEDYTPLEVELTEHRLESVVDLGEVKSTLEYSDEVTGDGETRVPSTMEGRIRAELSTEWSNRAHFQLQIQSPIEISGDEYDVQFAQVDEALLVTVDGETETVTTNLNFNEIEAQFPLAYDVSEPAPPGETSDPEFETLSHVLHLAGLSVDATFEAESDQIQLQNVGLGESTSWLEIDGTRAVTVDLNEGGGRSFDLTIRPDQTDGSTQGIVFDMMPEFDLGTVFDFRHVADVIRVSEWMEQYALDVVLDGAMPVTFRANDEHLKMTAGTLELTSENPEASRTVQEGQCLRSVDDQTDDMDPASYHPLRDLEVFDCSSN